MCLVDTAGHDVGSDALAVVPKGWRGVWCGGVGRGGMRSGKLCPTSCKKHIKSRWVKITAEQGAERLNGVID